MGEIKKRWFYLIMLAIIWGSSFILMKRGLENFTPMQMGALRIIFSSVILIAFGFKNISRITKKQWYYVSQAAFLGTFFPVFLFAFSLKKLDGGLASILNSLVPLYTLIIGVLFFKFIFNKKQIIGVLVGLAGTILLILEGANLNPEQDLLSVGFILLASLGYALNVNILKRKLADLDAFALTVGVFTILLFPAIGMLYFSGFFNITEFSSEHQMSIFYIIVLAFIGTALAKIFFNTLVQISTPIFSTSVTYLIPIVAVLWGIFDGEKISILQVLSSGIVLGGVYMVNKNKAEVK
ncbi:DMT family transporter [Aureivirga sp. CE67]|uniref:DMT family transporter n=1 Tax=Aureivirga sp. CE67 TaxID=1788983 RepID=UPI0018C971BE|nr:DMT family transporter [Aureivirga sp. CE67]